MKVAFCLRNELQSKGILHLQKARKTITVFKNSSWITYTWIFYFYFYFFFCHSVEGHLSFQDPSSDWIYQSMNVNSMIILQNVLILHVWKHMTCGFIPMVTVKTIFAFLFPQSAWSGSKLFQFSACPRNKMKPLVLQYFFMVVVIASKSFYLMKISSPRNNIR